MRRQKWYNNEWGMMKMRYTAPIFLTICAVIIFSLAWGIAAFDASYQHRQCNRYSRETGRETKYIKFSHWTYTCYVKVNGNRYVTIDQFRGADVDDR